LCGRLGDRPGRLAGGTPRPDSLPALGPSPRLGGLGVVKRPQLVIESQSMRERNPYQRLRDARMGRRSLLQAAAVALAGGAGVGGVHEAWETWKALHPPPYPYDPQLSATATAASRKGLETTLKAEAPFAPEMIQRVRDNTGIVILELADGTPIGRSAWLAQDQGLGDGYHIVTTAHDAPGADTISPNGKSRVINRVHFGRPYIDESFAVVDARNCTFAAGGSEEIPNDVDLITIPKANYSLKNSPAGIPSKDNYTPSIGDRVLLAGYPIQFLDRTNRPSSLLRSLTQGDVVQVSAI